MSICDVLKRATSAQWLLPCRITKVASPKPPLGTNSQRYGRKVSSAGEYRKLVEKVKPFFYSATYFSGLLQIRRTPAEMGKNGNAALREVATRVSCSLSPFRRGRVEKPAEKCGGASGYPAITRMADMLFHAFGAEACGRKLRRKTRSQNVFPPKVRRNCVDKLPSMVYGWRI